MLFDLKGKRKRAVQITYLGLAFLLAAGLIGAGIGSSTSGGLFDAITGGGGGGSSNADKTIQKRIDAAEKRLQVDPKNAAAYAIVIRNHYQLASVHSSQSGQFDSKGVSQLQQTTGAWSRYANAIKNPDPSIANIAFQAYGALAGTTKSPSSQKPYLTGAADAIEIVATAHPSVNAYLQLMQTASLAGQTRKATLAGQQAVALAPKAQKKQVQQQIAQIKAQAAQAQSSQSQQQPSQAPAPGG
jgi:hypothetical protein